MITTTTAPKFEGKFEHVINCTLTYIMNFILEEKKLFQLRVEIQLFLLVQNILFISMLLKIKSHTKCQ